MSNVRLFIEELYTLLTQVGALLNSCPLILISEDLKYSIFLTHGYVSGKPSLEPDQVVLVNEDNTLPHRWVLGVSCVFILEAIV